MLDPQKNVSVWEIDYSGAIPPTVNTYPFALTEAYVDAETGKLYGFAFRLAQASAENFDAAALAREFLARLGISDFDDITDDSSSEAASLYNKFATDGMDGAKTVFTVGFQDGVNEIFVKCY